jgi:hypothetical protein
MLHLLILLFILNGTYADIIDTCNVVYDADVWYDLSDEEKQEIFLCRVIAELNFNEKEIEWLNGTSLDWYNFAQKASEDYVNNLALFREHGIKESLIIDSWATSRDSLPPPMGTTISFDYVIDAETKYYEETFQIGSKGVMVAKSLSPNKQFKLGIPTDEVQCKEGFVLIIKASNGLPACVKPASKEKLIERGWARSENH